MSVARPLFAALLAASSAALGTGCGGGEKGGVDAPPAESADADGEGRDVSRPVSPFELPRLVPREEIPALVRALEKGDAAERLEAARSLRMIEREPWDALAFVDGELEMTGPSPEDALPALTAALRDPVAEIRVEAAGVIGRYGRVAVPVARDLLEMLRKEKAPRPRAAAIVALGKIGPSLDEVPGAITAVLEEKDAPVFLLESAATAVARIQKGAEGAVPILVRFLGDERRDLRRVAAIALGKIGPAAGPAVPALGKALADEHADVRDMAALALGRIRNEAPLSVPELVKALEDENLQVRRRAARSLGFLGESAAPAIPKLAAALRRDEGVAREAAWALGRIGAGAIPAISEILRDEASPDEIRLAAWRALQAANDDPER